MNHFLSLLPQIILAQALGVFLAWRVDAASWKYRPIDGKASLPNFLSVLAFMTPLLLLAGGVSYFRLSFFFVMPILAWLLMVAWVQKKQSNVSYLTAFIGAFVQFFCFTLIFITVYLALLLLWRYLNGVFAWFYLVSAILTYALLSLFRPTIYSAWNSFRAYSGKNRRVR